NLAAKKLHDADNLACQRHGESKRAVQSFLVGDRGPRKINVLDNIWNPGGLAAGPDAAGKSNARLKGASAGNRCELWNLNGTVRPEAGAAQNTRIAIHKPNRAGLPAEAICRGLQDVGKRFFDAVCFGQDA